MAEVLYYAIPFFVLLLVVEALSFRHARDERRPVGYEAQRHPHEPADGLGQRRRSTSPGSSWSSRSTRRSTSSRRCAWTRDDWWPGSLLFFADDLSYYWFHRIQPREPLLLGQPRRPPLEHALQPLDRAAPDLGADDLPAVLAAAAAAGLRALDGPAGAGVVADLPVLDPHRADRASCRAPLESVLNTPSHHRVHHGSNEVYLDRNYAGILIIWDRLFGTYEPRGRARPLRPDEEHRHLQPGPGRLPRVRRDVARHEAGRRDRAKFGVLYHGPGWSPPGAESSEGSRG